MLIDDNILRFQVPVNNVHHMQLLDRQNKIGQVHPWALLVQIAFLFKQMSQIPPACILQQKEMQILLIKRIE